MTEMPRKWKVSLAEGFARLPGPNGERWATMLEAGKIEIEIYAPREKDPQNPHTRDEVYFVMLGSGKFRNGTSIESFGPGDAIFVPAGVEHRFEEFTDDLVVWALFYEA